jgi:hypothetical protein
LFQYGATVHAYSTADWESFFTAIASAAAALTGLLFVAVSINLTRILEGKTMLPARAAETLATLVFVLISSALALVPQNIHLLGAEILVVAVPLFAVTLRNTVRYQRQNPDSPLYWSVARMTSSAAATVPGVLAGLSLAARWGGGFYWLVPTALLGIAGAVYGAWILLVEIAR